MAREVRNPRFGGGGAGKVLQRFRTPRRVRRPSSDRRKGSEGGGSGWGAEPAEMGGGDGDGSSRRHAAAAPGALPQGRARERGVGLEAWRVVHGRLEGRRPSHRELGSTGVAPRPPGSDARTIRVGGWGGLRRKDQWKSCTVSEWVPTVEKRPMMCPLGIGGEDDGRDRDAFSSEQA